MNHFTHLSSSSISSRIPVLLRELSHRVSNDHHAPSSQTCGRKKNCQSAAETFTRPPRRHDPPDLRRRRSGPPCPWTWGRLAASSSGPPGTRSPRRTSERNRRGADSSSSSGTERGARRPREQGRVKPTSSLPPLKCFQ